MEDAPVLWALFLPWILQGILQPHQKHGKELRPLSFAVSEPWGQKETMMTHCSKCGKVCDHTYKSAFQSTLTKEKYYLCKACWEQQREDAADFAKGIGFLFVHLVLPIIGICAIFIGCSIALVSVSEMFDLKLSDATSISICCGTSLVLSIPLIVKVCKTLMKIWSALGLFMQVLLCLVCPPLIVFPVIQLICRFFHRNNKSISK